MWTRSSVHIDGDHLVAGRWDGTIVAVDRESLDRRWDVDHPGRPARMDSLEDLLVVASRGERGAIVAYDPESSETRWSYDTASDVGSPASDRLFALPYVVALETDDDRGVLYAAARRYERVDGSRRWRSTIYAITADGSVRWRYETDASPIALALDADGERLAVGYNRCPGDHDVGLVVLDAASGHPRWNWDPGTAGDRRVGDVSFGGDHLAVSSHGDKRGYLLGPTGEERWRVDLATETEIDGETLYAYPTHVHARTDRVAFVTGNTYATDRRETEHRHPNEHRLATFDSDGAMRWEASLGGFAHELASTDERLVVPSAQNFRVRDPDTHAVRRFGLSNGEETRERFDGVATAVAASDATIAAIEEPVVYHDDGRVCGAYALWTTSLE
ncbi:transcriptional regulator [Natrarchaeobius oligotrophus]|uniref:Transcriptional regulator n=2 Tax=Natrarchaeobius TaxID=2501796 RepID=A0A3N6MDR3_NATCH|nr:transcriptional regulator [Natrarchaeobius chitinivorans]